MTDITDPVTADEFARYVAGFDLDGSDHSEWDDAMRGLILKAREIQLPSPPPARPPLHVRIITWDEGDQLVADLPDWPYPIPSVGQYLFHPPYSPGDRENIAGHVKSVGWRTHDRTVSPGGGFVQTTTPYVEIHI